MRKVVFLPCHPNMWEGFESIWEQEINSPETEVAVIPIPTYQMDSEGNLYDTEYLTSGYPDNVDILGVNDYNFEAEHPYTIYVQNIMDSNNPVFTVHPFFYTDNLRSFTEEIVYVPYNCMSGIDTGYRFLKPIYGNMLTPPGIKNVNKVIVHSKEIKEVYLALLENHDPQNRQQWDSKITYEDYPRIKILSKYTKETVAYPTSWNRHLFNTAGNRKKTVLFHTSVFGVLEFNRSHLRAVRDILEDYSDKKEDTALIWRPQKYLPEIITKYRPELFDDFRTLLEFFITNDIGIFDEMPTPTPSIILADNYIGDEGTVKELFKSTGKPILTMSS